MSTIFSLNPLNGSFSILKLVPGKFFNQTGNPRRAGTGTLVRPAETRAPRPTPESPPCCSLSLWLKLDSCHSSSTRAWPTEAEATLAAELMGAVGARGETGSRWSLRRRRRWRRLKGIPAAVELEVDPHGGDGSRREREPSSRRNG